MLQAWNFWTKVEELKEDLKSNESAFDLLYRLKDNAEKEENVRGGTVYSLEVTDKDTILRRIESIVVEFLENISNGVLPKFVLNKRGSYSNTRYSDERGIEMLNDLVSHEISLEKEKSVRKYAIMMNCLSVCYTLIQSGKHSTKRDIYYSNAKFFQNQHAVDEAISDISCMLGIPRHCLNVLSSSKGFIGGCLTFKDTEGNLINCLVNEGVQVPSYIEGLQDFHSNARFVLIIEKEATYQRLMEAKIPEKLGPCILITGKGFPDINTRMLIRRLWQELHIPIFALVDADPHGIEIMCIYKYGSKSMSHEASSLTCPAIRWLGILPKDIDELNIPEDQLIQFSDRDLKKAKDLAKRSYIQKNIQLQQQLCLLTNKEKKAEIECLDSISRTFMAEIYLPHKLRAGDWL